MTITKSPGQSFRRAAKPKESTFDPQLKVEMFKSATFSLSDPVLSKLTTPNPQTLVQQPL